MSQASVIHQRFLVPTGRIADEPIVREATELSLAEATDLLDWLEGNGLPTLDVELTPAGRMTVRWSE